MDRRLQLMENTYIKQGPYLGMVVPGVNRTSGKRPEDSGGVPLHQHAPYASCGERRVDALLHGRCSLLAHTLAGTGGRAPVPPQFHTAIERYFLQTPTARQQRDCSRRHARMGVNHDRSHAGLRAAHCVCVLHVLCVLEQHLINPQG